MKIAVKLLLVLGFCLGTVGAAGFHEPRDEDYRKEHPKATTEPLAWPLFLAGLVIVVAGGVVQRLTRQGDTEDGHQSSRLGEVKALVESIRAQIVGLDEEKGSLDSEEVRGRIDHLLSGEYFDLTSQNEELMKLLGFGPYASVWEGVATAERLLARTWSMATDGYLEEGLVELPKARENIERAAEALARL